ncbi:hypothetical protein CLAIMM_09130, partial [Cladophialophora immunda]
YEALGTAGSVASAGRGPDTLPQAGWTSILNGGTLWSQGFEKEGLVIAMFGRDCITHYADYEDGLLARVYVRCIDDRPRNRRTRASDSRNTGLAFCLSTSLPSYPYLMAHETIYKTPSPQE